MGRCVLFLNLNNFYVTAERELSPELEKKAMVVVQKGKIVDISSEAKEEGIRPETSVSHLRSVEGISILPYNEEHYLSLYDRAWSIVTDYATRVEPVDFHMGFAQLVRNATSKDVLELKERLSEVTQIESRVGGGPNKLVARLSSKWEMMIPKEYVLRFLSSVPIGTLDWVDSRVIEELDRLGISTLGEIKTIPEGLLKKEFPEYVDLLVQVGEGVDFNPVVPAYPEVKEEKIVELEGESDYKALMDHLSLCAEELSKRLLSREREALELVLLFCEEEEEKKTRKRLIRPISSHRKIFEIASRLLQEMWCGGEIYTIGIFLSQLRNRSDGDQLDFLQKNRRRGLEKSVERIQKKYGNSAIGLKQERRRMAELILEKRGRYLL
jgi:DNA polymerase-4